MADGAIDILQFTEVGGEVAGLAFEELDEIGGVVIAQVVGYLLDEHVGIAHHALRLKDDAVVDEGEGRLAGTFVDAFVEGTDGYVEAVGIFLNGMQTGIFLLDKATELDEELVGGLHAVKVDATLLTAVALYLDEEDAEEGLENVDVAELATAVRFFFHLLDEYLELGGGGGVYIIIRCGVEGVEGVVLEDGAAAVEGLAGGSGLVAHEVGTHLDSQSAVVADVGILIDVGIEIVYLPRREEEDGVGLHLVVDKVNGVSALALLKPQYLIECMNMR